MNEFRVNRNNNNLMNDLEAAAVVNNDGDSDQDTGNGNDDESICSE